MITSSLRTVAQQSSPGKNQRPPLYFRAQAPNQDSLPTHTFYALPSFRRLAHQTFAVAKRAIDRLVSTVTACFQKQAAKSPEQTRQVEPDQPPAMMLSLTPLPLDSGFVEQAIV